MTSPADVKTLADHEGLTLELPGANLGSRETLKTIALLSGGLDLFLLGMILCMVLFGATAPLTGIEMVGLAVVLAAMPLLMVPFMLLGSLRAQGSHITVRIEPLGKVSYEWMGQILLSMPVGEIRAVHVPEEGLPRVVLDPTDGGKSLSWRFRTREQAEWLADQIRTAMSHQDARRGTKNEVPPALASLRRES